MVAPYLSLNGARANHARLRVPFAGRWYADVYLDGAEAPAGAATLQVGEVTFAGTIAPEHSGAFVGAVAVRLIGGANGWGKTVAARSYHNDIGVKRADVVAALANDIGEKLDAAGDAERIHVDFTRLSGPAWLVLEHLLGATPWRVDFDGTTRYGARPAATLAGDAELLDVDSRQKLMTFSAPDPSSVPIGAVVSDKRLPAPLTVRELDIEIGASGTRITAWGQA